MFGFVNNSTLKRNITSNFIHASYLTSLFFNLKLDVNARSLLNNDALVHIGAIVEALLVYFLKQKGVTSYIARWRYSDIRSYYRINEELEVIIGKRGVNKKRITRHTSFQTLVDVAYKSNIISSEFRIACEEIRNLRNLIHFSTLNTEQRKLRIRDVEKASTNLALIVRFIKNDLKLCE